MRYERNQEKVPVNFEDYLRCHVATNDAAILIRAPEQHKDIGTAISPLQLQSPLLVFLLLHHRKRYRVLDIIQLFIQKIRPELTFLDFKKTGTGVTRCFTNTRFAAKVLREYGLLKFSSREAFKTWELSLAGFVVAATVLDRRLTSADLWAIPVANSEYQFDLSPDIRSALGEIDSYEVFVSRLASICNPNASVFRTFEPILTKAYELIEEYQSILKASERTKKDRKAATQRIVKKLEQSVTEEFYCEFSSCIKSEKDLMSNYRWCKLRH